MPGAGGVDQENGEVGADAVATFVRLDRLGALGGLAALVLLNGLFVRVAAIWIIAPFLVALVGALTVAGRRLDAGRTLPALAWATGANWLVAVVVSIVLPFLWPVMALTVLAPLVLATPHLGRRGLLVLLVTGATVAGVVASAGLINDDGGAIPDLDDTFEFLLVVGALMAQITSVGLIVWENNRLQRGNLDRARLLNRQLEESRARLAESRRRVVEAGDTERRRIERDLHDGAQQRLVALGVRLRLLEDRVGDDPELQESVGVAVRELEEAAGEVRELAHGIYPPLLRSQGLGPALRAAARRSPSAVEVEVGDVGRLDESMETALYFAALEALANAAKHAPDATVALGLSGDGAGTVELVVSDDGPGFDPDRVTTSHGTDNMADRLAVAGGELVIDSAPGRGTTVVARIPDDPIPDDRVADDRVPGQRTDSA